MKLKRNERRAFGAAGMCAYLSGALLFVFSVFIRVPTPVGEQHHAAEQGIRILHAVFAYGAVLAFGYLLRAHILPGIRARQKRRIGSGLVITVIFGVLLVSALLVLYGGEQAWSSAVALTHGIIGLGCPALIVIHAWNRHHAARASNSDNVYRPRPSKRGAATLLPPHSPEMPEFPGWQEAPQADGGSPRAGGGSANPLSAGVGTAKRCAELFAPGASARRGEG